VSKVNKKSVALFYLERQRLSYYCASLPEVHSLTFTEEAVRDLEVENKKSLERQISNWIDQHKIEPMHSLIALSEDIYFAQDFAEIEVPTDSPEYQQFISYVPFEDPVTHTFPLTQGSRTIVMNRELLQPIIEVLEKREFVVLAVSPAFALGELLHQTEFSAEIGKQVLAQQEVLFTYNVLPKEHVEKKLEAEDHFLMVKFDKKVLGLIGVFVLLLAILGGLVWTQRSFSPAPTKNSSSTPDLPAVTAPPPAVAPVEQEIIDQAENASPAASLIIVNVVVSDPDRPEVQELLAAITSEGLETIIIAPTTATSRSLAVLSTGLSNEHRATLRKIIAQSPLEMSIQESTELQEVGAVITIADE
jgi:hypothetical protein